MGDPRRLKKRYEVPRTLWDSDRISAEGALAEEYGLKKIREIWKAHAELRKIRRAARKLLGLRAEEAEKEMKELTDRVIRMGFSKSSALEDLLALDVRAILERRLQTIVFRKGLARTMKQARQLITHGFISVNDKKTTVPGYLVPLELEEKISYYKPIEIQVEKEEEKLKEVISEMEVKEEAEEIEETSEEVKEAAVEEKAEETMKEEGEKVPTPEAS